MAPFKDGFCYWTAVTFLSLGLTACSLSSSAKSCQVASDCSSGQTCEEGFCQAGLGITFLSPASGTVTNGKLLVQIDVAGDSPAELHVQIDEIELTRVSPPYTFEWDTSPVTEGTHKLWAHYATKTRTYESARIDVVVDRTPPVAPTILPSKPTKASPVVVNGTAEIGTIVTVYEDVELGKAVTDSNGSWQAYVQLDEGNHVLTASSTDLGGNVSPGSRAVAHLIDRTPPVVVSRLPVPDATNVWSRDPIRIAFSEPMDEASLPVSDVRYADNAGAAISKSLQWSNDRKTLTISGALPSIPNTLSIGMPDSLVDVAGNALSPSLGSWSWSVPEWQDLGSLASACFRNCAVAAVLTSGPGNNLVAASWGGTGKLENRSIFKWNGAEWAPIGPSPFYQSGNGGPSSMSIDVNKAGTIAVAEIRRDFDVDAAYIHASQWDGTNWIGRADRLNPGKAVLFDSIKIRIDDGGRPIVAWFEEGTGAPQLFVKRWDNSAWNQLGPGALNSSSTTPPSNLSVLFTEKGEPRITWTEVSDSSITVFIATWSQSSWNVRSISPKKFTNDIGSLVVDPVSELPVMGYSMPQSTGALTLVSRWSISPGTWIQLGQPLDASDSQGGSVPLLAYGPRGSLIAAWTEGGARVSKWDGASWEMLQGGIARNSPCDLSQLSVAPDTGEVAVLCEYTDNPMIGVFVNTYLGVRRYNK